MAVSFFTFCLLPFTFACAQQDDAIRVTLDASAPTAPLPKVFRANIDLSGRGVSRDKTMPQEVAATPVLDTWQRDIGLSALYRMQLNLWELGSLSRDKAAYDAFIAHYEAVIQRINDAGGVVIIDLFGTPAGMGKALDKKSPPADLDAFKEYVKGLIRYLSCEKRHSVWYEVWSAPDLEGFFLGRKQEYLQLYRAVAASARELEAETKVHIPVGGPATSWWFQNLEGNTIALPEHSLIYDLIRSCFHYRLPLDFITWHAYTTDPDAEQGTTAYRKSSVELIRTWLSYFHFDKSTPLIVDEWNFDAGVNQAPERQEQAYITASFIPARLTGMQEAGIDYGIYYCLEDFHSNPEGVNRNVGVFSFEDDPLQEYRGAPKVTYNAFRALSLLKRERMVVTPKAGDEFVRVIATRDADGYAVLLTNYIPPDIVTNYLSRNIGALKEAERRILIGYIKSKKIEKLMRRELTIKALRPVPTRRIRALLTKAGALYDTAQKHLSAPREVTVQIKNLKDDFVCQRYLIDSMTFAPGQFAPVEEKTVGSLDGYTEKLIVAPYSVQVLVLNKKPKEAVPVPAAEGRPAPEMGAGPAASPAPASESASGNTTAEEGTKEVK